MSDYERSDVAPYSDYDSEAQSGYDSGAQVQQPKNKKSWVHKHSDKLKDNNNGKDYFHCKVDKCKYRTETKKGQTSQIASHLKEKHGLKDEKSESVQSTLTNFTGMTQKVKKTFRQAFAELVAKQYLPFSLIGQKVLQDSYLAFLRENKNKNLIDPKKMFVTDKTVAEDIGQMAVDYIEEMKNRFKSKLSLCIDAWTGPNKMSFLGITFTYLDEDFNIQRGLLEMIKMKEKHSGEYMAQLLLEALELYGIEKDMVGGVTQDNAANCGTCVDALVKAGFDRGTFYGCFLHILNLACQAAITVYDPKKKKVRGTNQEELSEPEDSQDEEDPDFNDYVQVQELELEDVPNQSSAILSVSLLF